MLKIKDNEEIKEILEALRDSIDDTGTDKVNFINWVDKIEDYITNLQESEAYYYGQYKDYKSRNEKAIEFMKENCDIITLNNGWIIRSELTTTGLGKLFKILNGGDDNG